MTGFRRELRQNHADFSTRMGLLALVYFLCLPLIPPIQAHFWILGVCALQIALRLQIERLLSARARAFRARVPFFLVMVGLTNCAMSSMAILLWVDGGGAQRLMAILLLMGVIVHTAAFLKPTRITFASALTPNVGTLVALPAVAAAQSGRLDYSLAVLGALLSVTHVVILAWRQIGVDAGMNRALNDARRAREAAELATQAKSTFLATISHEIRTPMNAVVASAQLLERDVLSDAQRAHVSRLRRSAELTTNLLNDVLDLSKIEAGKMTLEIAPVDLGETLAAVFDVWAERAREKGLSFHVALDPALPERVVLDRLRLQQVLLNLLSNAVKFTASGEIRVKVAWEAEQRLSIEIADTGIGVAPENLSRIFDSFEQGGAAVAGNFGGTGLGLSISRQLVGLMGGRMRARSVPGAGSMFGAVIPAPIDDAPVARRSEAQPPCDLTGMRVLAVDDSEVNLDVLSALLEPEGVVLDLARDGEQAVRRSREARFDVILMDHRMPGMSGLEAMRLIKAGGMNIDTPVFAVTANALTEQEREWTQAGVAAFITKPIDFKVLLRLLAAHRGGAAKAVPA